MNWIGDRLLLIFTDAVCAFACWPVIRLTGEWFSTLMLVISYLVLFAENSRLRKLLERNGIDPRHRRARELVSGSRVTRRAVTEQIGSVSQCLCHQVVVLYLGLPDTMRDEQHTLGAGASRSGAGEASRAGAAGRAMKKSVRSARQDSGI